MSPRIAILALFLLQTATGCGRISFEKRPALITDAGTDTGTEPTDAGLDSETDAGRDSGTDAGTDSGAPSDAGTDSGALFDAGMDGSVPGCEAQALASLRTSLHGYWPFDGTGDDVSNINVDLNLIGDASYSPSFAPALGSALELDGDGDGAIGPSFLKVPSEYTVVVWARGRSVDGVFNSLVKNWGQGQTGQLHVGLNGFGGRMSNFAATQAGSQSVTAPTDFPADEWVHVAVVFNATALQQRLFINGARVAESAVSPPLSQTGATGLGVGVKPNDDGTAESGGGAPGYWDGFIDEVAIFTDAASDAEILLIYEQGMRGAPLLCE